MYSVSENEEFYLSTWGSFSSTLFSHLFHEYVNWRVPVFIVLSYFGNWLIPFLGFSLRSFDSTAFSVYISCFMRCLAGCFSWLRITSYI